MRPVCFLFSSVLLLSVTTGCSGEPRPDDSPSAEEGGTPVVTVDQTIPPPDPTTARLFEGVMEFARENNLEEASLGQAMQQLGLQFLEKPYLAGVLDEPAQETLICRLDGFDCVTFLESALAMARGIRQGDYTYDTYARHMLDQRYRDGEMDGYCSRLHYFTEWIADNEERGNVRDVTEEIGGVPYGKTINFMSTNRESYPRFASNDSLYQCILAMEEGLQDLGLHYIPQDRIRAAYDQLQAGDIVATATNINGLDVTHTGLVYDHGDGRMGLLHASTSGGVKVSPDLQAYVQDNRSQIGIVVARPTAR